MNKGDLDTELNEVKRKIQSKREEIQYLREYGASLVRSYGAELGWTEKRIKVEAGTWLILSRG